MALLVLEESRALREDNLSGVSGSTGHRGMEWEGREAICSADGVGCDATQWDPGGPEWALRGACLFLAFSRHAT